MCIDWWQDTVGVLVSAIVWAEGVFRISLTKD